jgi:hypothetical protein
MPRLGGVLLAAQRLRDATVQGAQPAGPLDLALCHRLQIWWLPLCIAPPMHLMGAYLAGVFLLGVHLIGVHLVGVHLMGVCLKGMHLIGLKFRG